MKNKKLPSIVALLILTLITVVFWIMFTIYRAFTKPVKITIPDETVSQITPKLDVETIEIMKSKSSV